MPAADAELELPAAVHADPALGARVVHAEEAAQRAEPARLDVHDLRRERERVHVLDAVDVGVPGDAVAVGQQRGVGLGRELGILDPRVRERLGDPRVERRVGHGVDDGALVEALEVDGVDGARSAWSVAMIASSHSGVGSSLKRSVG